MPTDRDCKRDCDCVNCDGKRTPLVQCLRRLSLEFAAMAEELDAEPGTRAIAISKALLWLAQRAEARGDHSILEWVSIAPPVDPEQVLLDIERTLAGRDIDADTPVEVAAHV